MELADLTPTEVTLEGLVDGVGQPLRLRAHVEASSWNGWVVPHFEEGEALRLVDALDRQAGCSATLDRERHSVVVRNEDADPPEETFTGTEWDGAWLYPVGAAAWCWEFAPDG